MDIPMILDLSPLIGRILIGLFFCFFGIWNLAHWHPTLEAMQQKKIPLACCFLALGIGWQMLLGFYIVIGLWVQLSAILLIIFTIVSVFLFHCFWCFNGEERRLNLLLFVTHLTATLGGLLLLIH